MINRTEDEILGLMEDVEEIKAELEKMSAELNARRRTIAECMAPIWPTSKI